MKGVKCFVAAMVVFGALVAALTYFVTSSRNPPVQVAHNFTDPAFTPAAKASMGMLLPIILKRDSAGRAINLFPLDDETWAMMVHEEVVKLGGADAAPLMLAGAYSLLKIAGIEATITMVVVDNPFARTGRPIAHILKDGRVAVVSNVWTQDITKDIDKIRMYSWWEGEAE